MKSFIRLMASVAFSLMLITGVSLTFTGCSAETLSGPNYEANATEGGQSGGTDGGGSEHNLDKTTTDQSGGTDGGGSEHNTDG